MINNSKVINSNISDKKSVTDSYNISNEAKMIDKVESIESAVNNSFFYSNNKIFEQMDVLEILAHITKKYPNFSTENKDSVIKKALIEIINDDEFIKNILKQYDISLFDLFKMFYRNYSSLFKGQYLKKLKLKLETKSYAKKFFEKG